MGEGRDNGGASQCGPWGSSAAGSGSFTAPGWSVAPLSGTEGTNVGERRSLRGEGEAVRRGKRSIYREGTNSVKVLNLTSICNICKTECSPEKVFD